MLKFHMIQTSIKTWFTSKIILFQETLEYVDNNLFIASNPKHLHARVPISLIWAIVCVVVTKTLTQIEPSNAF
jgi:hypothetical protein